MYQIVLIIQCTCVVAVLLETWIVLKNWKDRLHAYLFLSCIATLVNSVGYLLELMSDSEEAYYMALKASWIGRVWISFSLFLFIVELVKLRFPYFLRIVLGFINVFQFVVILITPKTELYYKNPSFSMDGEFPDFQFEVGPWQRIWRLLLLAYIVAGIFLLIRAAVREKDTIGKKRLYTVITAVFVESACSLINMIRSVRFFQVYDLSMVGFTIAAAFIFIAIFNYKLLDTETLVKEYMIDEISAGVIASDEDDNVDFYNKTALMIFPGLRTDPAGVLSRLRSSAETGEPIEVNGHLYSPEEKILTRDDTHFEKATVLVDSTGHYRHINELEEQKQIANNANKAKSVFLANMSHEIRTPINAVLGMDEMILRESNEDNIISYASDIRSAGRALLSLINDILDLSKIEEGKMEILPAQYELSSLINDLNNMIRDRAEKKGLNFEIDADPATPHILCGDETRLRQIILNLLTNAVKYTPKGSVGLNIKFEKLSEDEIDLTFTVNDTGMGMKEEDMDRLFAPYERIEEQRNRSIEGTGLGMSIVKNLLSLMNSQLEVSSVYGEGSVFSFTVSQKVVSWDEMGDLVGRVKKMSAQKGAYKELFHAPGGRLLVVDDTDINLLVITRFLKKTELKIDTASSGEQAINLAEMNSYDVMIIDHMMPGMDGIETLNRIKENEASKDAPDSRPVYIALTANAISGARERYLRAGFDDYLSKPVDGRQLEKILAKYLPEDKVELV